ncbi:tetraacyldisaccharide 4'-kinase [Lamprobacter modestohalophilus]|uniref:tetraacyldisaccharide 4'-kinase n=1 Tax=Lamprobacter modestohalophilus TaxID=1064514 RepID=UPI002ADEBAE7|nr:tetraacyldisaccharide 4'-kinase [Lamprobacter modestohalophilus]MEA1051041.1 tetraacyldisaccharide 4'-kinase [Lamprobacter modestohalophilus]
MAATESRPGRIPVSERRDRFKHRLKAWLNALPERVWYQGHWLGILLAPLGWLYCGVAQWRRSLYQRGWLTSYSAPVPVIVVGNLTVGGTGKTPLVLWLAGYLAERGYRPGIALRGYGRKRFEADANREQPRQVPADGDASQFGDEALLLAQRAGCPVMVSRDRVAAAHDLAEQCGCDLVITDDGLQHDRLRRQLEILVVDGERGFGNRRCLPAGPLREPVGRRRQVDLVIENGGGSLDAFQMRLEPADAVNLVDPSRRRPLAAFAGQPVTAVAGIGNPQRFFAMLRGLGLTVVSLTYPDHYRYTADDLRNWPDGPVLMTEKDAVKCRTFAGPAHWSVPVTAVLEPRFISALDKALERIQAQAPNRTTQQDTGAMKTGELGTPGPGTPESGTPESGTPEP